MTGRLDHPLAPAAAALLYACLVVAVHVAPHGGDLSALVRAAPPWTDPRAAPPGLRVAEHGYDGQFYYRLALDPFTDDPTDRGITFDRPGYRQQRIAYPFLAWIVSGGDERRAPLALVIVNVAAMFAIGWAGGALARAAGRHALWGLLFAGFPGFVVSLGNDLTEIVAAAFALGGLALLRSGRIAASGATLVLAALARETTALLAAAAVATRAVATPRSPGRWAPLALPLVAIVAWQLLLAARWQAAPAGQSGEAFDPPFLGLLAAAWLNGERLGPAAATVWAASIAAVFAMIVIAARALRAPQAAHERTAWYAYLAVVPILEANIWANDAILRTLTEVGMLTALLVLGAGARLRWTLLGTQSALSVLLVVAGGAR